jgi:hypothetical protein
MVSLPPIRPSTDQEAHPGRRRLRASVAALAALAIAGVLSVAFAPRWAVPTADGACRGAVVTARSHQPGACDSFLRLDVVLELRDRELLVVDRGPDEIAD